jgi:hypothetical protein
MRIMDVQEFRTDQYNKYKERRTSQFIKFLDKDVDFVTYFHINKNLSTTEYGNNNIDSYIGKDSPVRYNQINNLPVYGIPVIDTRNGYSNDDAGFSADDFSGELIMLPNIIEPSEGDCFILNVFDKQRFFQVTSVEQIVLKSKPHYVLQYHVGIPDYLPQLKKQVVEEYNAIFDNIGTHDKVVMSNKEYTLRMNYIDIYKDIMDYYLNTFFKPKITMFEMDVTSNDKCGSVVKYTDKFLTKFMEKNRIIVMDSLTKGSLLLDYNALYDGNDYLEYKNTLYWAVENKDMHRLKPCSYILLKQLASPFALLTGATDEKYYVADCFTSLEPAECIYNISYDNSEIIYRYKAMDVSIDSSVRSKVMSIFTNYFRDSVIMPGYFSGLYGEMELIEEYMYIPLILFIIREQINGLSNMEFKF